MSKFRKAIVAALLAAAGALAPFLPGGLEFGEVSLVALTGLVTGLATYGVRNEGFIELKPVAELARAAYERYSEVRGGVAFDGSPLPAWSEVETTVRQAWIEAQKAAVSA